MESGRIEIVAPGGERIFVNRYVIAKGMDHQLVLYWYQARGRVVASEYWAKFYLVADSIHRNRTDGALVRVITPVTPDQTLGSAQQRAVDFVRSLLPFVDDYIPR